MSGPDWLRSFVPLGVARDKDAWLPLGAGTLLIDPPVVWLITAARNLDEAGERHVLGWIPDGTGGVVVDMTGGRRGTPLDWIRHPEQDLAAALFPVDTSWGLKAFPEPRWVRREAVIPGLPVYSLGVPYALPERSRPEPLVLSFPGAICGWEPGQERCYATAPLLPRNAGAPLLVAVPEEQGGGMALVGVLTGTLPVPEPVPGLPAVRLAVGVSMDPVRALIGSEAARAQREFASKLQAGPA